MTEWSFIGQLRQLLQLGLRATDIKLHTDVCYLRQLSLAMRQLALENIKDGFGSEYQDLSSQCLKSI